MQTQFIETVVIQECMRQFADSTTEVEAVDQAAQHTYKEMQNVFRKDGGGTKEFYILSSKYTYLCELRKYLNNKRIEEVSALITPN